MKRSRWSWWWIALFVLVATPAGAQQAKQRQWIDVEVGKTVVRQSHAPLERILLSDPTVADVKLLEKGQFSLRGLKVGTTDLWLWYKGAPDSPEVFEVTVHRDLSELDRRIRAITDAPVKTYSLDGRLVVEGDVPDVETAERIAAVARLYDEEFVNMLRVPGDHQVQLEVVFAEVDRRAIRELGLNFLVNTEPFGGSVLGPNTAETGGAVYVPSGLGNLLNGGIVASPTSGTFTVLGLVDTAVADIAAVLAVLQQHDLSRILAQPTLVALTGQQAEFLAGGEVPIPVAQFGDRISVEYKEYGVKVVFVPTVLGDQVIDLRVYVEVSEPDSTNSIRVTGLELPGFLTRKSESHLRVASGKTFAMAGLLNDRIRATRASIPLLGDIPVLGALFSYVRHERIESELMIFVTPRLVRPLDPEDVPPPPGWGTNYDPTDFELFLLGRDHRRVSGDPAGPVGMED